MNLTGHLKIATGQPASRAPRVSGQAEIARKYCHILRKYGPHSTQVRHAALVMSTEAGDSDVLMTLDAILEAQDRLD